MYVYFLFSPNNDKYMKPIERLALFCKLNKIRYSAVERNVGIANGYLSKQVNSKASIGSDILEKICNTYPDLNPAWLLTGRGEPKLIDGGSGEPSVYPNESDLLKLVRNEHLELYKGQIVNLSAHIELLKREIVLLNNTIDYLRPGLDEGQ
jgi:transcriptional regulator with XRE-family HTH domain